MDGVDTRDTQGVVVIAFLVLLGCAVCTCWIAVCCLRVQNVLKLRKMNHVPPPPPPKARRKLRLKTQEKKKKHHHKGLKQSQVAPMPPTAGNLAWEREWVETKTNMVKNFEKPEESDEEEPVATPSKRRKHRVLSPQQREDEFRKQEKAKEKDRHRELFMHCEGARDAGVVRGEVELAEEAASDAQMQRREARENKAMHKKNAGNAGVNPALARGRSKDIVLEDI
jgi:hypothetical protein